MHALLRRANSVATSQAPWLWPNLLSLDAPLVALVWQDFLARCYPSVLHLAGRWVLGLTVWAIYLADRLIDVRHPAALNESVRHRFYRQNRGFAKALLTGVLSADLLIALVWLRPAVFSNGLMAGAAVVSYLAVFAFWRIGGRRWKQPSAAMLFTVGVFLVAGTGIERPWQVLGGPAAAFFALCLGNMVLVETWEERRSARRWIRLLLLALLCAAVGRSRWYDAIAVSAVGLAALDLCGGKLTSEARGVLADAVLFVPVLFR